MRSKIATCFLIGLTAVGCSRRSNDTDRGLGAGADSAALHDSMVGRDTSMVSPGTARPVDTSHTKSMTPGSGTSLAPGAGTTSGSAAPYDTGTTHRKLKRSQTQSGVTDKNGTSTLGKNIRKTRPDVNEPVTAKGDTLTSGSGMTGAGTGTTTSGSSVTDSLNRAQLQRIQGNDTMPARQDSTGRPMRDSTVLPTPTDSTGRPDSVRPLGTDTLHRTRTDSMTPPRDSTKRDSVPR